MRAIIADDAALWRESLSRFLTEAGIDVVATVGDAEALTEAADREQPEIALIDVRMPPTFTDDGLRAALWIRRNLPGVGVLVLCQSVHAGPALELLGVGDGGVGYLLKERVSDVKTLIDAVTRVAGGGSVIDPQVRQTLLARRGGPSDPLGELTPRELEVLESIAEGWSNQTIADRLFVTRKTVEAHIHTMMLKLGIPELEGGNPRVHAVLTYLRASGEAPSRD